MACSTTSPKAPAPLPLAFALPAARAVEVVDPWVQSTPQGGCSPNANDRSAAANLGWPPRTVVEPMRLEATAARRVSSVTGRSVCICKEACRDAFALSKSGAGARAAGQERRSRRMLACSKMRSEGRRRASGQPGGGGEGGRT